MISVLIVDDEHLIRKLVRNSIEWDSLQMEVVGEAENGEEAIQFLNQQPVDIAIVDINMPFINGLEFAEYVFKNRLRTKVILLTGYREFEYARQAIQWNVVDYLMKPLQPAEMEKTLRHISTTYYKSKRKLSSKELEMAQLREAANGLSKELPKCCQELSDFFAVVLKIDGAYKLDNLRGELAALCERTSSYIDEHFFIRHMAYVEYDSYVVHFICTDDELKEKENRIRLADELREQIRFWRGYTITAGLSSVTADFRTALQEGLDAASNRFYRNSNCTYADGDAARLEYSKRQRIAGQMNTLLTMAGDCGKGTLEECESQLKEILEMFRVEQINEDYVKMTVLNFILSLYTVERGDLKYSRKNVYHLTDYEHFADFEAAVKNIFHLILDDAGRNGAEPSLSPLTAKVRAYIDEQFADRDICLNSIAANVYANSTYISNQFKKEMGLTITEYITSCRMKKAQQLLSAGTKNTLQEIADEVGYNDPYYFSKSFKKYYGTTPSRYIIERN